MVELESGNRIAVISDIHGNTLALESVLADVKKQGGVHGWWFVGDYAAIGYDPAGVLDQITALPDAHFVGGNTDRYLAEGALPWDGEAAPQDQKQVELLLRIGRSFAWTTGAVASGGYLPWIRSLPLDFRAQLSDGTRVLAVHARPGADDGYGIHPRMTRRELEQVVQGAEADLILVGHVHYPQDHRVDDKRIVNSGGVSNPLPPDLRAKYAVLHCGKNSHQIEFRQVEYDRELVIQKAREFNHPAWEYIALHIRGERVTDWMESS